MTTESVLTPLMRQYFDIKNKFIDALVLFQVGDFYELFFDDAHKASAFLGIVLTQRGTLGDEPIPLCGVPRHTVEHYIVRLVKGGFRVVICDQLEAPQPGKIVERGVTQVFTPGTLIDTRLLESKSAHYLGAMVIVEGTVALVFYEMLAGMVYLTQFTYDEKKIDAELSAFMPQEILVELRSSGKQLESLCKQRALVTTFVDESPAAADMQAWMLSLKRLSQSDHQLGQAQHTVLMLLGSYLAKNASHAVTVEKNLLLYDAHEYLQLDAATQKNLELVSNSFDGSTQYTLFQVIDEAVTAMGSRLLKKWLMRPLRDAASIAQRADRVDFFVTHSFERNFVRSTLKKIGDLERTLGRIMLRRAAVADYRCLMESISDIPVLEKYISVPVQELTNLYSLLRHALYTDQQTDWKIAPGYHDELDRLRALSHQGMQAIFELERQEQQKTGINTLKIRYSPASGYAIEVSKAQSDAMPAAYIKVQTLTHRDRFTTQALKDLEYDIERAQRHSVELEQQLFSGIVRDVERFIACVRRVAGDLAELDAVAALAEVAVHQRWVRPVCTSEKEIIIRDGRHPVIEKRMASTTKGALFVPNSTHLSGEEKTWILTGPNMGGKSTYLRQVALIAILAHIGSFVPATQASIPVIDRIFTRIGAGDNLAEGKSTFLVEMEETALICGHATEKSLVILDEVGRGTSTYDGLALAQAIVEYLHQEIKPFCLFATHYHELTELSRTIPGITSYYAASKTVGDTVVLLHKIMKGVAHASFGIQVARAAQLPASVITRARLLLAEYSHKQPGEPHEPISSVTFANSESPQAKFLATVEALDLDTLSPRQAYDILCRLKEL